MPKAAQRKTLARKLLFSIVALLVGIAVLEGGVRVWNRVKNGRWTVTDPESRAVNHELYVGHTWLGQMPRPGADITAKGRHITINSFGYRGPEFSLEKPEGVVRIACIGGSTTFDVKVTDDSKTWPAQLGTALKQKPDLPPIEVINAATPGYALPRTIIDLELRTLDIKPDWIICYPGVNDVAYADRPSHQFGEAHRAIVEPTPPPPWTTRLLARSEIYNEIVSRVRYARQIKHGNWFGKPIERSDTPDPRGIEAFERNLTTLIAICRAHGIELALVTVRAAYSPDQPREEQERLAHGDLMDHPYLSIEGHYAGYGAVNRLIRQAAKEHGLVLIDQAIDLPSGAAHFDDSVHFNDEGAAAFGRYVCEMLAPHLASAQGE